MAANPLASFVDWTYPQYLQAMQENNQSGFSESGASNLPNALTQEQWAALSPAQKYGELNQIGGMSRSGLGNILPGGPGYDQLAAATGATGGHAVSVGQIANAGNSQYWTDPSKNVDLGNGLGAYTTTNQTPYAQAQANKTPLAGKIIEGLVAAGFGGGLLGAAGSGSTTAGMGEGWSGYGADPSIVGGSGEAFGGGAGGVASGGGLGPGGGLDPETAAGAGAMSVAQNGIGPGGLLSQLQGAFSNPSSLLSSNGLLANGAQGLLSSAISNPVQALGLLQMARGAIGSHGPSSSNTSGSSKPQGGTGVPNTGTSQRAPWQPNPYTAAQLSQYLGGH